jgi:hypothetical protein
MAAMASRNAFIVFVQMLASAFHENQSFFTLSQLTNLSCIPNLAGAFACADAGAAAVAVAAAGVVAVGVIVIITSPRVSVFFLDPSGRGFVKESRKQDRYLYAKMADFHKQKILIRSLRRIYEAHFSASRYT